MLRTVLTAALLTAALFGGCGRQPEPQPEDVPAGPPYSDETLPETAPGRVSGPDPGTAGVRAETREDTLWIEGTPEPRTMRLVRSTAGFAPPFSTYMPPDMRAEFDAAGDTGSVRFAAAFDGAPHPNAYMHVRTYPRTATRPQAQQVVHAFLRSRAPQATTSQPMEPPGWAEEGYSFRYDGDGGVAYVGRALIGHHDGHFFHVLTHYPAEFGDGLGPRLQYILAQWRWEATGALLVGAPHD